MLTKNYFSVDRDFYLQIKGTAMETTMAPNYANLYDGLFVMRDFLNETLNPFLPYVKYGTVTIHNT